MLERFVGRSACNMKENASARSVIGTAVKNTSIFPSVVSRRGTSILVGVQRVYYRKKIAKRRTGSAKGLVEHVLFQSEFCSIFRVRNVPPRRAQEAPSLVVRGRLEYRTILASFFVATQSVCRALTVPRVHTVTRSYRIATVLPHWLMTFPL